MFLTDIHIFAKKTIKKGGLNGSFKNYWLFIGRNWIRIRMLGKVQKDCDCWVANSVRGFFPFAFPWCQVVKLHFYETSLAIS